MGLVITRDPDVPAEVTALCLAFDSCASGHTVEAVFEASVNFVAGAISMCAKSQGGDAAEALSLAEEVGKLLVTMVHDDWTRTPQPTDIEVRHG